MKLKKKKTQQKYTLGMKAKQTSSDETKLRELIYQQNHTTKMVVQFLQPERKLYKMGIQNMKNRNVGKYKRPFYPLLKLNAIQYIKICEIKPRQYIRETFIALRCLYMKGKR